MDVGQKQIDLERVFMESLIDKADTGDLLKTLRSCSTKAEMERYAQECEGTKRPEEIFREKIDDGTVTLQQINARSSGFLRRPYISRVMDGECGNPDRDRINLSDRHKRRRVPLSDVCRSHYRELCRYPGPVV